MLRMLTRLYRRIISAPWQSSPWPASRYRPERHYMRGAGPASQRKTGSGEISEPAERNTKSVRHREPA
jgi:hypothetical protein